jgi:hypothetical protein
VGLPGRRGSSFSGTGAPPSAAPGLLLSGAASGGERGVRGAASGGERGVRGVVSGGERGVRGAASGGERGGGELGFERGRDVRAAKCGGEMRRQTVLVLSVGERCATHISV